MADDKKPPSQEETSKRTNTRSVPRPHIQVPTLPPQQEKTLQDEVNAVKNQTNRGGMENLSAPSASAQTRTTRPNTDPTLADKINAAQNRQVRGVEHLPEDASVRPDPSPAVPQNTANERGLGRSYGNTNAIRNPPTTVTMSSPSHTTSPHVAEANRKNLTQENSGRDERDETVQDNSKEQAKNKDRDKGKDNER
jgi:hypothetical protein